MNREQAIKEVEWYRSLVRRKIKAWGYELNSDARSLLIENLNEVIERQDRLQYKELKHGYYIGELDEEGLRNGFGITTHTTADPDRWVMQAGEWHEECPMGWHTFYDSDCPKKKHFLALVKFSGERKHEAGTIHFSIAEYVSNFNHRTYRRYAGFRWTTLAVGLMIVFMILFILTRRIRLSLIGCVVVALLYALGSPRERQ